MTKIITRRNWILTIWGGWGGMKIINFDENFEFWGTKIKKWDFEKKRSQNLWTCI